MKVIGSGSVHIHNPIDECPHRPGPEPMWQESMVLYVFDVTQGVYVYMRVSHEPNRGPGYTTVWLSVWTPEYIYKRTDDSIPRKHGDIGEKFLSPGAGLCRYEYDGTHKWQLSDGETQLRVSLEDYHPGFGYYNQDAGFLITDVCPRHIEATGWVTGTVTLKGKTYQIAGQGWRDHSWGPRDWRGILAHRFYPALFGRDFNFFCVTMLGRNGTMAKFGTVVRGDTVQAANDFDIIAYIAEDGVSNHGGRVTLRFDGETRVLEYEPFDKGAISLHQDLPCVDTMCRVRMGERVGVGVAETTNRPQGGTGQLFVFPNSPAILADGIFPTKA